MTDELNVLAGAYVLDALDAGERRVFEDHLQTCEECTEEVRGMRATAAELSRTVEVTPPPQLRAQVLAAVSQVRPLPPVVDNVVALRRLRASRSTWQVLAAACALIAVIGTGWGFSQHQAANRAATAQARMVASLIAEPDVSATTTSLSQGSGTVIYAKDEHKVVLIGRDMPALPAGKTYQLWMLPATGKAVSGGTFTTDSSGNVAYQTDGDLSAFNRMGISVEPAGGSAQPTPSTVQLLNI
jgi:anti-sigma-K factor RskA